MQYKFLFGVGGVGGGGAICSVLSIQNGIFTDFARGFLVVKAIG